MSANNDDNIPLLFSPLFFANPYPTLSYLRQQGSPYHFSSGERSFWVVTRYQDGLAILKDAEHFVKDHQKALTALSVTKVEDRTTSRASQIIAKTMVDFDPPDHTRLRSLVSKAFTPRRIEQLRPRIEEIANDLL